MRILNVFMVLSLASMLVSCESNGPTKKSEIGTYGGAIIGGLIGSRFGDGVGRTIAIALGAAAGAYLGHEFGGWLDERDEQDVAKVGGDALDSTNDGETMAFTNPETGFEVAATPKNTKKVSRDVQVIRLTTVEARSLDIIGKPYVARKSSNLRAGPSANAVVVGGLRPGESFDAIGRVLDAEYKGHGWIAVGKAGGV